MEPVNRRVIVIDDNESIHRDYRLILAPPAAGAELDALDAAVFGRAPAREIEAAPTFEVDSALQGDLGSARIVEAYRQGRPYAAAFVDVRMPPGWDGLRTIREFWPIDDEIQVVICTAYADYRWEDVLRVLGRSDRLLILKKPFEGVEVRQLALALSMKWSLARGVRTALAELEGRVSARTRELEEAAARLEREIADKNDFLRNVTHDLSAPLRNIVGMLDAVAPACADRMPPEARDRLARARRSAQAELALIGEMLDFARLRARPQSAAIEDVGRIVKDVADSLTADLEAKGIRLEVAPAWPAIRCERPRVAQAFQNYIDNAIKYMGATPGARIAVAWHEDASRYVFRVEDNGTGIPADQLGRLFQIFTRGMNAASCAEGRGIGLAAVRAIAEAYGGTAWASSEVGRGSTFYFSLSKSHVAAPPSGT